MSYIAERVKAQPKGTWIVVRYAFPTRLAESRFPTRAELDAVAPDHMVLHQGGPAGVVNTQGAGVIRASPATRRTRPPGRIVKDPRTGEPTGMLRNAYSVLKGVPETPTAMTARPTPGGVKKLFALYNERGITSIGDRGASVAAPRPLPRPARRRRADRPGQRHADPQPRSATGRRSSPKLNDLAGYDTPASRTGRPASATTGSASGRIKVFLDGGMLNGTAYMREPWGVGPTYQITEPDYRGLLFIKPEVLRDDRRGGRTPRLADDRPLRRRGGHGRAARRLRARRSAVGIRDLRWLITHANFTSAENLERCAELGVGADLQPAWLYKDTRTLSRSSARDGWAGSSPTASGSSRHHDRRRQRPHDPPRPDRSRPTRGTPGWASGSP